MASAAHCLMCFEALDAHLEDREPLSLSEIESSWALYTSSVSDSEPGPSRNDQAPKTPALRRLAADADSASASSSSASPAWSSSTPATSMSSLSLGTSSAPLFVTWNTVSGTRLSARVHRHLSVPTPRRRAAEYATISALHDTRFSPIVKEELSELQAAVTLLTDFEEADDAYDWEVGTHGIRLSFTDRGHGYGATYLPDVASSRAGLRTRRCTASSGKRAGWAAARGGSRWSSRLRAIRARRRASNYPEYKKWKDWVVSKQ